MKKAALFLGILCIGLLFFRDFKGKVYLMDHNHEFEQDSEDVWWG